MKKEIECFVNLREASEDPKFKVSLYEDSYRDLKATLIIEVPEQKIELTASEIKAVFNQQKERSILRDEIIDNTIKELGFTDK